MQEGKVRFRIRMISCSKDTLQLNGESQSFWVFSAGLKSKQLIEKFWFYNGKRIASFSFQNSHVSYPRDWAWPLHEGRCRNQGASLGRNAGSNADVWLTAWLRACWAPPSVRVTLLELSWLVVSLFPESIVADWFTVGFTQACQEYLVRTSWRGPAGMRGGPCWGRRGTCNSRWRWQTFRFLQLRGWRGLFKDKSLWYHLT